MAYAGDFIAFLKEALNMVAEVDARAKVLVDRGVFASVRRIRRLDVVRQGAIGLAIVKQLCACS
jgi:hypothetical protein